MPFDQKVFLAQIDALLDKYNDMRSRARISNLSDLSRKETTEFLTLAAAAVERLSPPGSRYIENLHETINCYGHNSPDQIDSVIGILNALRFDFAAGTIQSITELIHADIIGDFLEMADHLLDQGYKDASAVITGTVLEEHLRKLCNKNGIATTQSGKPKKADTLNAELANANTYSKLDQKSVTAWLDLRNKAAHGRYNEYMKEQVALFIQALRDFVSRNPA